MTVINRPPVSRALSLCAGRAVTKAGFIGVVAVLFLCFFSFPPRAFGENPANETPALSEEAAKEAAIDPTKSADASPVNTWATKGELVYAAMRGENGIRLGEARLTWEHDGEKYTTTLSLKTTGLIDAIYHFEYTQNCRGRITQKALLPDVFWVSQKGRDDERATFNWETKKVTIDRRGKKTDYDIGDEVYDVLSVWHVAALFGVKALVGERMIVTNRRVYAASVTRVNHETLRLPIGKVAAERFSIKGEGVNRLSLELWLAAAHHNMPARILMTDNRGGKVDLQLKSATGM